MGNFGGDSFAGGTAIFGGDESAERRFFELYKRFGGTGALDTNDETKVRTRWLQGIGDMAAVMESEAIKQGRESVPCQAIDQLDGWEAAYGITLPGKAGTTYTRQQILRMVMNFVGATANIKRIENAVIRLLDATIPDGGLNVTGYENTGATAIGDDGIRYFCILVPEKVNAGYGEWLTRKAQRPLYRGIKAALRIIAPANTVPALSTANDQALPPVPAFYTDGYNGCACNKDCVGS